MAVGIGPLACVSRSPAALALPLLGLRTFVGGTFRENSRFKTESSDRGESYAEISYRSRSGGGRGRGSCHAHHGGCALEGWLGGPGAWRIRRRRARRKRLCTALLCVSVRVWSLLRLRLSRGRLRVSGVLQ